MLKNRKISLIIFIIFCMIILLSSCKKEEYVLVETAAMSASANELPEDYESYDIKSFKNGDYVLLEEIHSYNVDQLKIGDVVAYFDNDINMISYKRIVYMNRNEKNEIETLCLQGDLTAAHYGVFDPDDDTKVQTNYDLQCIGVVITFSRDDLRQLKGKVIKVKYTDTNPSDEW